MANILWGSISQVQGPVVDIKFADGAHCPFCSESSYIVKYGKAITVSSVTSANIVTDFLL